MKVSRGIEIAVEEGIEEMVFNRYRYRRGVEIAFKKMLEKLDRWQGIEEELRRCQASFKNQFFEK